MPPTVVITASAGRFPGLGDELRDLGAVVEERPLLHFAPPLDWTPFDAALDRCVHVTVDAGGYAAVAFTSPRAAQAFVERLRGRGMPGWEAAWAAIPELWAAGPGTARALVDVARDVRVPDEQVVGRLGAAAALAEALVNAEVGTRGPILFPCGDYRRDELPAWLRQAGLVVDDILCYRSVFADVPEARTAVAHATVLVVASPSVVDLLARAYPAGARPALLAVGPTTAAASRAAGWPAAAVAEQPTVAAVAAAARTLLS